MNAKNASPWDVVTRWLNARREKSRLEETLTAMSDRQLADIGIKRQDIETILAGGLPERGPSEAESFCPRGNGGCHHCGRGNKAA